MAEADLLLKEVPILHRQVVMVPHLLVVVSAGVVSSFLVLSDCPVETVCFNSPSSFALLMTGVFSSCGISVGCPSETGEDSARTDALHTQIVKTKTNINKTELLTCFSPFLIPSIIVMLFSHFVGVSSLTLFRFLSFE